MLLQDIIEGHQKEYKTPLVSINGLIHHILYVDAILWFHAGLLCAVNDI